MKNKSIDVKGIIYYIISMAFIVLSFSNIFAAFMVVPIAAGFALAAYRRIGVSYFLAAIVGVGVLLFITANVFGSIAVFIYVVALMHILNITALNKVKYTLRIGWAALVSAVLLIGVFFAYLYINTGKAELTYITTPIVNFGNSLSEYASEMLLYMSEAAQLPEDVTLATVQQFRDIVSYTVDSVIVLLPSIFGIVLTIGAAVAQVIAKCLAGGAVKEELPNDGIATYRLSAFVGFSYLAAMLITVFLESGMLLKILLNYTSLVELPLFVEGVVVVYRLLTSRTDSIALKVVIAIAIGLSFFGLIINLTWIYVFFGIMDTYNDFRGKLNNNQKE